VLPYFSGERSTGWAANARAVFAGPELYRFCSSGPLLW
jgi:hypothetical protein